MARCGCCAIVGIGLAIALAVVLYPLSQWDADVSMRTRILGLLLDHVLPSTSFTLSTLLGWLTGRSQVEAGRAVMHSVGSRAFHDAVRTEDLRVAGVPVRLYRPAAVDRSKALPVLVYFHGGGFVTGSIGSHNPWCLQFCNHSSMAVVSVDYRLAPEHMYPAAFEDCLAVTKEVVGNRDVAELLAIDATRVSVGGDSAGGGLSAAVSLYMGRTDLPALRSQVSIFPTLRSVHADRAKLRTYSAPGGLTPHHMFYFRSMYLGGLKGAADLLPDLLAKSPNLLPPTVWEAAFLRTAGNADVAVTAPSAEQYPYAKAFLNESLVPLLAKTLRGTPPTVILLAMIDPLLEDGQLYGRRLRADGIDVELKEYANQIHGFTAAVPVTTTIFGRRIENAGSPEALDVVKTAAEFVHDRSK